jgi:hypothetical protein
MLMSLLTCWLGVQCAAVALCMADGMTSETLAVLPFLPVRGMSESRLDVGAVWYNMRPWDDNSCHRTAN